MVDSGGQGERRPRSRAFVIRREVRDGRVSGGFVAEDTGSGREVVIRKLMDRYRTAEERRAVRRRFEALKEFSVPGTVHLRELLELPKGVFLVEEYVEGVTLAELIGAYRGSGIGAPPSVIVIVGNQLVRTLNTAHLRGIVHGNLSPRKVLIDPRRDVKLSDFMFFPPDRDSVVRLGRYAAPELLSEPASVSAHSDTYAAAMVLLELVAVKSKRDPGRVVLPTWFGKFRPFFTPALARMPEARTKGLSAIRDGLAAIETELLVRRELEELDGILGGLSASHGSRP